MVDLLVLFESRYIFGAVTLSIVADYCYTECRFLFIVMLSVMMLSLVAPYISNVNNIWSALVSTRRSLVLILSIRRSKGISDIR